VPADFLRLSRLLDLSAENRVITNIGNAGTDFTASGGLTLAGDLTINGNFVVNGGTSNVQSTTVQIDDKNIELAHSPSGSVGNNAAVDGGGITLVSSQGNKTFNWVNSTSAWTSSEHLNLASGKSFYVNGTLLSNVAETLVNKILTNPVLNGTVSGTFMKDEDNMASNSASHVATQQSIKAYVDTSVAAENELSEMNDVTISSIADNNMLQYDSSSSRWVNKTFIDFAKISAPSDPSTEEGRLYLKEINSANNALAVKLQKASNIVEVELTSPGATCECGSTDGAKDPVYNFPEGTMTVELYCGHKYEMDIPNLRRLV